MSRVPESHLDILNSTALAYIATSGPKGAPQVSPVWFGWDGSRIFFSMNSVRQKHRNLRRDPRLAIAIADPTNPYRSLEIRGVARIDDDPTHDFAKLLSQKYLQRDPTSEENPPQEARIVVMVEPEQVFVFPFPKPQ
jgi:PPOX class probable F420-dependent enzyme